MGKVIWDIRESHYDLYRKKCRLKRLFSTIKKRVSAYQYNSKAQKAQKKTREVYILLSFTYKNILTSKIDILNNRREGITYNADHGEDKSDDRGLLKVAEIDP